MSGHRCPSIGCDAQVPSGMFACRPHWFQLPKDIRDSIWAGYRAQPGGVAHWAAMEDAMDFFQAQSTPPEPKP